MLRFAGAQILSTQFLLFQSLDNEMLLFHSTHTQTHLKVSCLICHKSLKLIHLQFFFLEYVIILNLIKYIQSFAILLLLTFSPEETCSKSHVSLFVLHGENPFANSKCWCIKGNVKDYERWTGYADIHKNYCWLFQSLNDSRLEDLLLNRTCKSVFINSK